MFFVTQNRSEILKNSQLLAVRLSGYALVLINEVAIRRAQLVPGWITVLGRVNQLGAEPATQVYSDWPFFRG